jgi:phosphonate transport system substrate-binding protein
MLRQAGLLIAAALGFAGAAFGTTPLRIAPLPMENREATVKAFNPVVKYLQQQLGRSVELVYFDKNSEIVAALQSGTLDLGMLGPLPYVTLRKRAVPVEPLVLFREANGESRYRCALVVFGGDSTSLRKLRGKRVALTQPLSTCGYLGTNAILRQHAGITLEETRYSYLNTHEAAALAVVGGEADAAGIKDEFAIKYAGLGLTIAAYSDWVPGLGLFANRTTLSDMEITDIRRILLATPAAAYQNWGNAMRYGMTHASDKDFDPLRKLGDPASIPATAKGN